MKIAFQNTKLFFKDLSPGDVFRCADGFYMKLHEVIEQNGEPYNAVWLAGANAFDLTYLLDDDLVDFFPDAKIVIGGIYE